MIEWIVSSSVLTAVVIALRYILRGRISLRIQYALWILVLIRLLVPFSFGNTGFSVLNMLPWKSSGTALFTALPAGVPDAADFPEKTTPAIQKEDTSREMQDTTPHYNYDTASNVPAGTPSLDTIAYIIWFIGIAVVGLFFISFNLRFAMRLKKTRRVMSTGVHELPVYVTNAVDTPCLFGLLRPAVYITPEATKDATVLRHTMEHELTHFRHRDNLWPILRGICLALHWYNPLVWWAAFLSRADSELACDEATISRIGENERCEYGRTLIEMTCHKRTALFVAATTMTGTKNSIKERIMLIAGKPKTAIYTLVFVILIAAVAIGCTFTGADKRQADFTPVLTDSRGITSATPISCFFTSHYDRPEDINLAEFLRYFPGGISVTDEDEFNALNDLDNWPFGRVEKLEKMPVPVKKFTRETIDQVLWKYAGITSGYLSGVGSEDVFYLEEYDAFYNYTSDFAAGVFQCARGEVEGDTVRLYAEYGEGSIVMLTLMERDGRYFIYSHQRIK